MPSSLGDLRITFIGAGNMAEALVNGLLKTGVCRAEQLAVTDVRPERINYFRAAFGVAALERNFDAVQGADVVVLAVKPQTMAGVLRELKGHLERGVLVISIAAGIPTRRIEEALGGEVAVVRVMPNTPALVGAGASAICPGRRALEVHLGLAEVMMGAVGLVVQVSEEAIDAVTAISGSGPAYVFFLMEAMLDAARRLKLDDETARKLVLATVEGSARLMRETGAEARELRERVTSKGGTTAAALDVLAERAVYDSLIEAMKSAEQRARELSGS